MRPVTGGYELLKVLEDGLEQSQAGVLVWSSSADRRKLLGAARGVDLHLNDLDVHVVPYRVVGSHGAVDHAAVVEPAINVPEEVGLR